MNARIRSGRLRISEAGRSSSVSITPRPRQQVLTMQAVLKRVRQFDLETQHGRRECLSVVVQAEAARDAAAECSVAHEVERFDVVNLIADHLAADGAVVEALEAVGRQLLLQ